MSASSFFQVNSAQAEKLVQLVGAELPGQGRLLVDAYAGVGTFAAIFAGRFERVIAIEESPSALGDAEVNLEGVENVEFRRAKVEELLPNLAEEPDVVLLDPPRVGCAPEVLDALVAHAPPTIVYVSCNPTTLARDLKRLTGEGYTLERVTPIDMFPQTAHIECVSRLTRPAA